MATSDAIGNLLRLRARLLGWVLVVCVIPGAVLLAAGVTPQIVLAVVFTGTALMPLAVGPFALKASPASLDEVARVPEHLPREKERQNVVVLLPSAVICQISQSPAADGQSGGESARTER